MQFFLHRTALSSLLAQSAYSGPSFILFSSPGVTNRRFYSNGTRGGTDELDERRCALNAFQSLVPSELRTLLLLAAVAAAIPCFAASAAAVVTVSALIGSNDRRKTEN